MKKYISMGLVALVLGGCTSSISSLTGGTEEPKWLIDPYVESDKIAAVGCAGQHFNGVEAQKKLAISRAIDQIATQTKVSVSNVTLRRKSSQNGVRGNSSSQSTSLQSVDNVSVQTRTKALYTKPNGDICAWVVSR